MNKNEKQKFSVSSPKHQDNAYLTLWDPQLQLTHSMGWDAGTPSSKRIVEDMMRIPKYSILKRYNARGCVVPGCGTCRGQCDEGVNNIGGWGGKQCRQAHKTRFIHPDAEMCLDELFSHCEAMYQTSEHSTNQTECEDEDDNDGVEHHVLCL
eukprot:9013913-Ditylum_brightwellii.AAC.1